MVAERDPSLIWRPLSEATTQPTIYPYQWIVHTAVDSKGPTNLHGYFEQWAVNLESHTWLRWDRHEQFIPFNRSADANYKVNRFLKGGIYRGAISTETEDDGNPEGNPWNTYQVDELVRFGVWLNRNLGIPPVLPSGPYEPGMGYHSLFPMVWTNVKGKTCPGGTRIRQWKDVVLPRIRQELNQGDELRMDSEARAAFDAVNRKLDTLGDVLVGADKPELGTQNPRHNSVVTRLGYLFGESLAGDNLGEFRALLDNAVKNAESIEELKELMGGLEDDIRALTPKP